MQVLPDNLARQFREECQCEPVVVVRALSDIEGNLGETYVAASEQQLALFSKRVGEVFRRHFHQWRDLQGVACREDRPFCYLDVQLGDVTRKLKFSGSDHPLLQKVVELAQRKPTPAPPPVPSADQPPEPATPAPAEAPAANPDASEGIGEVERDAAETHQADAPAPYAHDATTPPDGTPAPDDDFNATTAFCACIHEMVAVDGTVHPDELYQLSRIFSSDMLAAGRDALNRFGIDDILKRVPDVMDASQRLCLLANMMEIAMTDGVLRSAERKLLQRTLDATGLGEDNYNAIYDVLLIKNNLGVFSDR